MRKSAIVAAMFVAGFVLVTHTDSAHAETIQSNISSAVSVVVQPGDSLSKIASRHGTTYKRLYDANEKITNPDLIFAGDTIRVPGADEVLPERPLPAAKPVQPAQAAPAPKRQAQTAPAGRVAAAPKPATAPVASNNAGVWDRLAMCESTGNWHINTGNGYYGGLQFSLSSWRAVGGTGYPHQASKAEQIMRAEKLRAIQGWGAWPACSAKLGLR